MCNRNTPVPPLFQVHTRVKGIEDVKRTVFDNHEAVKAESYEATVLRVLALAALGALAYSRALLAPPANSNPAGLPLHKRRAA